MRAGSSRLFSRYARVTQRVDAADKAIEFAPADPEGYYERALAFSEEGRTDEAARDFETSARLRPFEYSQWLKLGIALDLNGDQTGAQAALKLAVRRAPYYAQPRWQLGNVMLRAGLWDEAFAELRRAYASDPELLPATINLAWGAFGGDAQAVLKAVNPETQQTRLAVARFLSGHGNVAEAIELFRAAGGITKDDRRALLNRLLADGRYREAYEAWMKTARDAGSAENEKGTAKITDGSFENLSQLDEPGFGWQVARNTGAVEIGLDDTKASAGTHSLRLEWRGNSDPSVPLVSQLVLVEPDSHYKLSFAARTDQLVTGGLPLIIVTDAGKDRQLLGEAAGLAQGTNEWRDYSLEFETGDAAGAVLILLQRRKCDGDPCPAFGSVWLDDFSLRKL